MILKLFRILFILAAMLVGQAAAQEVIPNGDEIADYDNPNCCYEDGLSVLQHTRLDVGYSFGKFIGIERDYAEIGLFVPVLLNNGASLLFGDGRSYRFNNSTWAASGGLGFRTWMCESIWGVNAYYDWYEGHFHKGFNRWGIGLEWLGTCWDLRANGYFPVGKQSRTGHHRLFNDYIGGFVATCKHKEFACSEGFDAEIGIPLGCWCNDFSLYAATGPYYYRFHKSHRHEHHNNDFWGGYARLELGWRDLLFFQVRTSYDHANHSQTQGQVYLSIPFDLFCGCSCIDECLRFLTQPVRRIGIIFTDRCCVYRTNW